MNSNVAESGLEARINKTPFKRLGKYSDMVQPAVFLASDESNWVTGTGLVVDGGFTV